jgi:MoaA/NifB/PqqE/SkfB family radical SAM enzyme
VGRWLESARGYLDRRTPGYLVYFVTPHCNCRCKMCFNSEVIDQAGSRRVLSLEEIAAAARGFPGLHHLNLSGGEPFLRQDLTEIPPLFYRHSGARFITVATNSSLPEKVERDLEQICRRCPDAWIRLNQSLDGIGERHDAIRGRPGLFDSVLELNRRLARLRRRVPNLTVAVIAVLSGHNRDHILDLIAYAYRHLEFDDLGVLFARGRTREPADREADADDYWRAQEACAARMRERSGHRSLAGRAYAAVHRTSAELLQTVISEDRYVTPCTAGRRMVVMDDQGGLQPCEVLQHLLDRRNAPFSSADLGNIRDFEFSIQEALASQRARDITRYVVESKCYCSYECAMAANVLYTPALWPRVARNLLSM